MTESELKLDARKLAEAMGYVVFDGLSSDRLGVADKLFMRDGRGFVVEFKIIGGIWADEQKIENVYCSSRGVPYYLCWTLEEFKDVLLTEEKKYDNNSS